MKKKNRFRPTVDGLESRQLLSTAPTRPPADVWTATPGPITVTQGQVDHFTIPNVSATGKYQLDMQAEQSVFDSKQPLSTIWAVVTDKATGTKVDDEIISPTSVGSYAEAVGTPFTLQAGHQYDLYLNEGTVGGSDVLIQGLRLEEITRITPVTLPGTAVWTAAAANVMQGQVTSFGNISVPADGQYQLNLQAEQSVFDTTQPLSTVRAVVVDHATGNQVDNEILSVPSTSSYAELTGGPFSLQAGHQYDLYLSQGTVGGSDILVRSINLITVTPTSAPVAATITPVFGAPDPASTFDVNQVVDIFTFTVPTSGNYQVRLQTKQPTGTYGPNEVYVSVSGPPPAGSMGTIFNDPTPVGSGLVRNYQPNFVPWASDPVALQAGVTYRLDLYGNTDIPNLTVSNLQVVQVS